MAYDPRHANARARGAMRPENAKLNYACLATLIQQEVKGVLVDCKPPILGTLPTFEPAQFESRLYELNRHTGMRKLVGTLPPRSY